MGLKKGLRECAKNKNHEKYKNKNYKADALPPPCPSLHMASVTPAVQWAHGWHPGAVTREHMSVTGSLAEQQRFTCFPGFWTSAAAPLHWSAPLAPLLWLLSAPELPDQRVWWSFPSMRMFSQSKREQKQTNRQGVNIHNGYYSAKNARILACTTTQMNTDGIMTMGMTATKTNAVWPHARGVAKGVKPAVTVDCDF